MASRTQDSGDRIFLLNHCVILPLQRGRKALMKVGRGPVSFFRKLKLYEHVVINIVLGEEHRAGAVYRDFQRRRSCLGITRGVRDVVRSGGKHPGSCGLGNTLSPTHFCYQQKMKMLIWRCPGGNGITQAAQAERGVCVKTRVGLSFLQKRVKRFESMHSC